MTSHPARKRRKLVLHLDVNNTVFIGDSITKQVTPESALNEYLVDVVWGKRTPQDHGKAQITAYMTNPLIKKRYLTIDLHNQSIMESHENILKRTFATSRKKRLENHSGAFIAKC